MEFRFYINGTEIDEPVGFDATKIKLKRSENWHGVMAEASEETIEVYGAGFTILSGLYATYGIDAVAVLRIEYYCGGVLEDTIEYNITFYEYSEFCGNDCYCVVGIEKSGCYYQFRNAMDTKVDLDALKAIDKTTDLAEYQYLGSETEIPSKTIRLTSKAITEDAIITDLTTEVDAQYNTGYTGVVQIALWLPFETEQLAELQDFVTIPTWELDFGAIDDTIANDNFTYKNVVTDIQCLGNSYDITVNSSGTLSITTTATLTPITVTYVIAKRVGSTPTTLYSETLIDTGGGFTKTYNWDVNQILTETLTENDLILCYIFISAIKTTTGSITDFTVTHDAGNLVSILTDSLCASTNAKLYLVNETLSHISEYVTNNCLRVYSEYLGRTDSSPYNFADDGCGGMLALTSGLFLRRIEDVKTGDQTPILSLSFNEVLNAINAIYPIGFTIEENGTDEIIRIEDWTFFYNDTVIADIGNVAVKKSPNLKLHFKNYKTGYAKYEAEEYNGLDEFLTEREYATSLVNHNGILEKVCQFIASGYAIEITRRKGNIDTKDWRFDNDTFIIALDRNYSALSVEQGNIINDANIIDASTILNYRISPARMAMNWFKYITTFLKTTKELLFSSGKGNISAEGELVSVCSIESGAISEKQNLQQTDFTTDQNGYYYPELHTIEGVPFTFQQYKSLKDNPHGLFAYQCDSTQRYGWASECTYSFVDGTIDLVLIPKV